MWLSLSMLVVEDRFAMTRVRRAFISVGSECNRASKNWRNAAAAKGIAGSDNT